MVEMTIPAVYDRGYLKGIALFNRRRFFEAHEAWEQAWQRARGKDREFLQGLIQTAVALHHFGEGNLAGAAFLYPRSRKRLDACGDRYWGLNLKEFSSAAKSFFSKPRRGPMPEILWLPGPPAATLLYDGKCRLCRAILRLLRALDLFAAVRKTDFHEVSDLSALHPGLTRERCAARIQLLEPDGRISEGFPAVRQLSLKLVLLWPLAPILHLPGADRVGRSVYDWVACRR